MKNLYASIRSKELRIHCFCGSQRLHESRLLAGQRGQFTLRLTLEELPIFTKDGACLQRKPLMAQEAMRRLLVIACRLLSLIEGLSRADQCFPFGAAYGIENTII